MKSEDDRFRALMTSDRVPLQIRPVPNKIIGCKILAVPFINGINVTKNPLGFSDLIFCSKNAQENGSKCKDPLAIKTESFVLSKMAEILFGMICQKKPGTPSVLDFSGFDDERQIASLEKRLFSGTSEFIDSGYFLPKFSDFWMKRYSSGENVDYYNLAYLGIKQPKNSGGKGNGKNQNNKKKSFRKRPPDGSDDDDDDDDGNAFPRNGRNGRNNDDGAREEFNFSVNDGNGLFSKADRKALVDELKTEIQEKIVIVISRIPKKNGNFDASGDSLGSDPTNYKTYYEIPGVDQIRDDFPGLCDGRIEEDDDYMGYVVTAIVKDPLWDPVTVMRGLCKNTNDCAEKKNKSFKKKNPMFVDWTHEVPIEHVSTLGFDTQSWNRWATYYRLLCDTGLDDGDSVAERSAGSVGLSESSFSEDAERNLRELEPVDFSGIYESAGFRPDGFGVDRDSEAEAGAAEEERSEMLSPAIADEDPSNCEMGDLDLDFLGTKNLLGGSASVANPADVFSVINCAKWLVKYGGDVDEFLSKISTELRNPYPHEKSTENYCSYEWCDGNVESGRNVKGVVSYRIPYDRFFWRAPNDVGLSGSYLPWKEDVLFTFIKQDLLGISKKLGWFKNQIEICVRSPEDRNRVSVKRLVDSRQNIHSQIVSEVRQNQNFATMAETRGFSMDLIELPSKSAIEKILSHYSKNGVFPTNLEAESVYMVIYSCLMAKKTEISDLAYQNSLILLSEKLDPLFELILKEKVNAANILETAKRGSEKTQRLSNFLSFGPDPAWFYENSSYCRQFSRYVRLRNSFEKMAAKSLQELFDTPGAVLTDTLKSVVDFDEKFGLTKKDRSGVYECNDFASGALGNFFIKLGLEVRFILHIPHATHHFILVLVATFDATRYCFGLHFNILNTGDGATSKSFVGDCVVSLHIPGVVHSVDDESARASNVSKDLSDRVVYEDETSSARGTGQKSGGQGASDGNILGAMLKKMLTSGLLDFWTFAYVENPKTGKKHRDRQRVVTNCQGVRICNGNDHWWDSATLTRFYRAMYGKVRITFGPALKKANKAEAEKILQDLKDRISSGESVTSILKNVDKTHLEIASKKFSEETIARNEVTREMDALLSSQLPNTSVTQAMFLSNLMGPEDSPIAKENDADKMKEKIRSLHILIVYAFKMMQVHALPEVNLTLAHMVSQKYFAFLKKNGNVEIDNYRVYTRFLIVARLFCIIDAIHQVFYVDGCDVPFDVPVTLDNMRAMKPYLFCNFQHSVMALTFLSEEYINPFNSSTVELFGTACCHYPTGEELFGKTKNWDLLVKVLDRLKIKYKTCDLGKALQHISRGKESPLHSDLLESYKIQKKKHPELFSEPAGQDDDDDDDEGVDLRASKKRATDDTQDAESMVFDEPEEEEVEIDGKKNENLRAADRAVIEDEDEDCDDISHAEMIDGLSQEEIVVNDKYRKLAKKILKIRSGKNLMPHEIYAIYRGQESNMIKFDETDVQLNPEGNAADGGSSERPAQTGDASGTGGPNMAFGSGNPNGQWNRPQYRDPETVKKIRSIDLRYLSMPRDAWGVSQELSSLMLNLGPSQQDLFGILTSLSKRTMHVDYSYSRSFSEREILEMVGKNKKTLLKEGVLVREDSLPICKARGRGYRTDSRFSLCVFALGTTMDPSTLMKDAIKSMIYQKMKPVRLNLGFMLNAGRGVFDWLDITEDDIARSKNKNFSLITGGYMTERERNIIFNGTSECYQNGEFVQRADGASSPDATGDFVFESRKKPKGNDGAAVPAGSADQRRDDAVDASAWGKCSVSDLNDDVARKTKDFDISEHKSKKIKITTDLDEWIAVRHFQNVGVAFGPHPKHPSDFCWYHKSARKTKCGSKVLLHSGPTEYRRFPTGYYQHLRFLKNFISNEEKFKNTRNRFPVETKWIERARKDLKFKTNANARSQTQSKKK